MITHEPGVDVHSAPGSGGGDQVAADDDWIRELQATHGPALYSYLLRLTLGDRHMADDMLRQTLARARRYADASTDPAALRPWLFTLARRIAIDAGRTQPTRPPDIGHDDLNQAAAVQVIRQAIAELPSDYRDVIAELYVRQRSAPEAAEVLGIPVRTVQSRAYDALHALRDALTASRGSALPDTVGGVGAAG